MSDRILSGLIFDENQDQQTIKGNQANVNSNIILENQVNTTNARNQISGGVNPFLALLQVGSGAVQGGTLGYGLSNLLSVKQTKPAPK